MKLFHFQIFVSFIFELLFCKYYEFAYAAFESKFIQSQVFKFKEQIVFTSKKIQSSLYTFLNRFGDLIRVNQTSFRNDLTISNYIVSNFIQCLSASYKL